MSDSPPRLSVVIPAFCEGSTLLNCIAAVHKECLSLEKPYEIILIDDGSPDQTWEVIQQEAGKSPVVRGFRFTRNFGKEAALCAGLDMARGEAIILMDADMQHPPSLIPSMVHLWEKTGVNIVEAVKTCYAKETIINRFRRKAFYTILNRMSGFDLGKASDYKLIDKHVRDAWLRMGEKNVFFRGMIAWLGFKRAEIPFTVPERAGGQSKWSLFCLIRLAVTGITAFTSLPMHVATFGGVLFLVLGMGMGIYSLALKVAGKAIEGFTTVIILQLFTGSLILVTLGVIGEYIGRIFDEVKNRPRYVIIDKV